MSQVWSIARGALTDAPAPNSSMIASMARWRLRAPWTAGSREMRPIARDEAYRTVYEAIHNACRHSASGQVEIALIHCADLALRVRDDGAGMDSAVAAHGQYGHFEISGIARARPPPSA